jgi:hypothetical protein
MILQVHGKTSAKHEHSSIKGMDTYSISYQFTINTTTFIFYYITQVCGYISTSYVVISGRLHKTQKSKL